jgi:glycosyltransferase involved in cell wall biosynthesis
MRLSLALCTFNGAAFLREQLTSIEVQTPSLYEAVLCDDGSSDDTVGLLRQFAVRAAYPVKVVINPSNLGSTQNFAQAISLCTGDAIVLSDQDDIWRPNKLALIQQALEAVPQAGFVFSDALLVNRDRRPLGGTLWDAVEFRPSEQERFCHGQAFNLLLRRFRVTGATMAFRSCFRDLILPIPAGWIHDAWIALLIAAVADCVPIGEPLIEYRQHPEQQLGERKRGFVGQYHVARAMGASGLREVADRFAEALDRLHSHPAVPPERIRALKGKVRHASVRAAMRERKVWRLPLILREAWRGNYSRYSRGWKAIAQDLFLS